MDLVESSMSMSLPLPAVLPTQGCISQMFRVESCTLATAKIHSPDVPFSSCSSGLDLERGWSAQRSLPAYKRNILCFTAALRSSTLLGTGPAKLMARHHAPDGSEASTETSCTHLLRLTLLKCSSDLLSTLPVTAISFTNPSHDISHRLSSPALIPASRVNHLLVRSAHGSIDERRCQVVDMTLPGLARRNCLQMEMEAVFGDVLCSLL